MTRASSPSLSSSPPRERRRGRRRDQRDRERRGRHSRRSSTPDNYRSLSQSPRRERDVYWEKHSPSRDRHWDRHRDRDYERERGYDRARSRDRERDHDYDRRRDRDRDRDRDSGRYYDRDRDGDATYGGRQSDHYGLRTYRAPSRDRDTSRDQGRHRYRDRKWPHNSYERRPYRGRDWQTPSSMDHSTSSYPNLSQRPYREPRNRRDRRRLNREPVSPSKRMPKQVVDDLFLEALILVLKYRHPPFNISIISDYMSELNREWSVRKSDYVTFSELCRAQESMGHLVVGRKGESVVLESSPYVPDVVVPRPREERGYLWRKRRREIAHQSCDGVGEGDHDVEQDRPNSSSKDKMDERASPCEAAGGSIAGDDEQGNPGSKAVKEIENTTNLGDDKNVVPDVLKNESVAQTQSVQNNSSAENDISQPISDSKDECGETQDEITCPVTTTRDADQDAETVVFSSSGSGVLPVMKDVTETAPNTCTTKEIGKEVSSPVVLKGEAPHMKMQCDANGVSLGTEEFKEENIKAENVASSVDGVTKQEE